MFAVYKGLRLVFGQGVTYALCLWHVADNLRAKLRSFGLAEEAVDRILELFWECSRPLPSAEGQEQLLCNLHKIMTICGMYPQTIKAAIEATKKGVYASAVPLVYSLIFPSCCYHSPSHACADRKLMAAPCEKHTEFQTGTHRNV